MVGLYTLRVRNHEGTVLHEHQGHNIVTNRGYSNVFAGNFGNIVTVGNGRAAEEASTTALNSPVMSAITGAWATNYTSAINATNNVIRSSATLVCRSAAATGNFVISEIGISNSTGDLNTYSLIRDIDGSLTTVTVNTGEILEIEYEIIISATYVQWFTDSETSLIERVTLYRLPALHSITNSATKNDVILLKSKDDDISVGSLPTTTARHTNVGTTRKANGIITSTVPANSISYADNVFGYMVDNLNGFTLSMYLKTPHKIDSKLEYTARYVLNFEV